MAMTPDLLVEYVYKLALVLIAIFLVIWFLIYLLRGM